MKNLEGRLSRGISRRLAMQDSSMTPEYRALIADNLVEQVLYDLKHPKEDDEAVLITKDILKIMVRATIKLLQPVIAELKKMGVIEDGA